MTLMGMSEKMWMDVTVFIGCFGFGIRNTKDGHVLEMGTALGMVREKRQ